MSSTERLHKVLAAAGIASRRASEEIIAEGRVQVNGKVVLEQGVRVDPAVDEIQVDGVPLPRTERHIYVVLNKPMGVLSTASDERGRTTVLDLVPVHERVYPVGRLDVESEGLLLLTNDGELTELLTHPRYGHKREYRALVRGIPPDGALKKLRRGIQLEDGPTGPAEIEFMPEAVLRREKLPFATEGASWMKVIIREGRKRQIRHMFESIGHPVLRLIRVGIGPLTLGDLPEGQYRFLSQSEVQKLHAATAQPERRVARGLRRRLPGARTRQSTGDAPPRGRAARAEETTARGRRPAARAERPASPRPQTGRRRADENAGSRPERPAGSRSRSEIPAGNDRRRERQESELGAKPDRRTSGRGERDEERRRGDRAADRGGQSTRRENTATDRRPTGRTARRRPETDAGEERRSERPADNRDTRPGRAPRRGGLSTKRSRRPTHREERK